jgi:hypothetical protein
LLFDPRRQVWLDHFRWQLQLTLTGVTETGRATVNVLRLNAPERCKLRAALFAEGLLRLD